MVLPEGERKSEKHTNKGFQKNADVAQSYISRIPPPKPLIYNPQKTIGDLPYSRSTPYGEQSSNYILQNSRILHSFKLHYYSK